LESALFEAETPKSERSEFWKLEQELKKLNAKCSINSGRGERYERYVIARMRTLNKIAKFRQLTGFEQDNIDNANWLIKKYYTRGVRESRVSNLLPQEICESDETRLLASVLQKLDALPGNMPYNTIWTTGYVVAGRFGLTPDEELALRESKAWKADDNGHTIDRAVLKMSANRPDAPINKKNIQQTKLASTSDRIREEIGTYFEEEEKEKKVECVACGGTGKSSTGRPCEPCRIRKMKDVKKK
jgi:hypothetical protein